MTMSSKPCSYHGSGLITTMLVILLITNSVTAIKFNVSNVTCSLPSDYDSESRFSLAAWVTRGACIRRMPSGTSCDRILNDILSNLNKLREAEYAGAASVLSLLPTIGALFGAPTSEIWRLKSIVPFGGALAMTLSFGGALMPGKVEDYEFTDSNQNTAIGSIISLRNQSMRSLKDELSIDEKLEILANRVRERIDQHKSVRLPKHTLLFGLFIMLLLFALAQAAMAVVEQGGLINWWCSNRWWMHFWYVLAFTEDRVQRPFVKTYKLYVSSLPYDVETSGGQPITDYFSTHTATENVAVALKQLRTLKPASVSVYGSRLRTQSRNSVMIMVSVVGESKAGQVWKLLSKLFSVTVFVTGTAIFASVTLLSLIMAIVVVTLTLAAGFGGRAISSWIIGHVSGTEPMIHVISNSKQEAYQAITEILCLKSNDGTHFQVEIDGQIFINERRVASRSWLRVALLGIIAEPYDITKAHQFGSLLPTDASTMHMLSPRSTNLSMGGGGGGISSFPFLSGGADYVMSNNRMDHGLAQQMTQQSLRSFSGDGNGDSNGQISRKPVAGAD